MFPDFHFKINQKYRISFNKRSRRLLNVETLKAWRRLNVETWKDEGGYFK